MTPSYSYDRRGLASSGKFDRVFQMVFGRPFLELGRNLSDFSGFDDIDREAFLDVLHQKGVLAKFVNSEGDDYPYDELEDAGLATAFDRAFDVGFDLVRSIKRVKIDAYVMRQIIVNAFDVSQRQMSSADWLRWLEASVTLPEKFWLRRHGWLDDESQPTDKAARMGAQAKI